MSDILTPQFPSASSEEWIWFELLLPDGYRHVGAVERPDSTGQCCGHGEMYDLGQNAEGLFRLFRRGLGEFENSHNRGEPLSDDDLRGFGLTRSQSPFDDAPDDDFGDFSSLSPINLIKGV